MPRRAFPVPVLASAAAFLTLGWAAANGGDERARGPAPATSLTAASSPLTGPAPSLSALLPPPVVSRPVATPPVATPVATPRKPEPIKEPGVRPDEVLAKKLAPITKDSGASLSVAVRDLADGRQAQYGTREGATYDTASIVKVDILVTLLLQAQDGHRDLTAQEKRCATAMIEVSDNASADVLWKVIGGARGLDAANHRLGLTGTTAGAGGRWGLTQTTAADQLVLLSAVFGDESELNASSRRYVRKLMGQIAPDQAWGVSAAGETSGLKNGWLPRTTTGLWDINSIGLVTVAGQGYLLAVVSKDNPAMDSGVSLVEAAAKAAASAMACATCTESR
ncbi:serine hydrolase [Streptomyces sp. NPDC088725]|uniref:serine hydrolase n=1 Tax=Streptomyces sp. NPDC088725 TaxID=3365873 RepID=UPI0038004A9A